MLEELIYTSAPRGLFVGTKGYCTVAATAKMNRSLREFLELISGYRHLFPPGEPGSERNPVSLCHHRCSIAGRQLSILSRIADAGLDYSGRSNKIAHHVSFQSPPAKTGPAAWLSDREFHRRSWDGAPTQLPSRAFPQSLVDEPGRCVAWEELTGDAGWAGVIADTVDNRPAEVGYIVFEPGNDLLPLFVEAERLIDDPWQFTFSTYYLPTSAKCQWRCVPLGSDEARKVLRRRHSPLINLAAPGVPPESIYAASARDGVPVRRSKTQVSRIVAERITTGLTLVSDPGLDPLVQPIGDKQMPELPEAVETAPSLPETHRATTFETWASRALTAVAVGLIAVLGYLLLPSGAGDEEIASQGKTTANTAANTGSAESETVTDEDDSVQTTDTTEWGNVDEISKSNQPTAANENQNSPQSDSPAGPPPTIPKIPAEWRKLHSQGYGGLSLPDLVEHCAGLYECNSSKEIDEMREAVDQEISKRDDELRRQPRGGRRRIATFVGTLVPESVALCGHEELTTVSYALSDWTIVERVDGTKNREWSIVTKTNGLWIDETDSRSSLKHCAIQYRDSRGIRIARFHPPILFDRVVRSNDTATGTVPFEIQGAENLGPISAEIRVDSGSIYLIDIPGKSLIEMPGKPFVLEVDIRRGQAIEIKGEIMVRGKNKKNYSLKKWEQAFEHAQFLPDAKERLNSFTVATADRFFDGIKSNPILRPYISDWKKVRNDLKLNRKSIREDHGKRSKSQDLNMTPEQRNQQNNAITKKCFEAAQKAFQSKVLKIIGSAKAHVDSWYDKQPFAAADLTSPKIKSTNINVYVSLRLRHSNHNLTIALVGDGFKE